MQGSIQHRTVLYLHTVQQVQYIAIRVVHLHDRRVFGVATDKLKNIIKFVFTSGTCGQQHRESQ